MDPSRNDVMREMSRLRSRSRGKRGGKRRTKKKRPPPLPSRPLVRRHKSLIEVQNASQVRKRIAAFKRKGDIRFERKKETFKRMSVRSSALQIKKGERRAKQRQKPSESGTDLFRNAVSSNDARDSHRSIEKARSKHLVSGSAFRRGTVTGYVRKEQRRTGKLNPQLMKKFGSMKISSARKPRAATISSSGKVGSSRKSGFFSTMRNRASNSKVGKWMASKRRLMTGSDRSPASSARVLNSSRARSHRKIANDLRKSKQFRERGSHGQDNSGARDKVDQDHEVAKGRKLPSTADVKVEPASLRFNVIHPASMFRQLRRVILFFEDKIEIWTDDGDLRHNVAYVDGDVKIVAPERLQLLAPIFPKGYGMVACDAPYMYLEFNRRKVRKLSPVPKMLLSPARGGRNRSFRKSKLLMMTGLTEAERIDKFIRGVVYDTDTDEGRTRLHFLSNIPEDIAREALIEKLGVFMSQMTTFLLKNRCDNIQQILDDGEADNANDEHESGFGRSVRQRVRLRVEEAVYLPMRDTLRKKLLSPSSNRSERRKLSASSNEGRRRRSSNERKRGDDEEKTVEEGEEEEKEDDDDDDDDDDDVDLNVFKNFPQHHWGIEHESPSNWAAPVAWLCDAGNALLPSESLACVLGSAKAIFSTFKVECASKGIDTSELGADDYLPVHIYCLSQSGAHLKRPFLRVREMLGFCDPEVLRSESGYYLTSMESALEYLKNYGLSPVEDDSEAGGSSKAAEDEEDGKVVVLGS